MVYGGKTVDPTERFRRHRHTWPGCVPIIHRWVPVGGDWVEAERAHVAVLRATGAIVLNKNGGGGGPVEHTDAAKAKQSLAGRGRVKSEAHRLAIGVGLRGNKNGKGLPAGRKLTAEHREAIGNGVRGRTQRPEWVQKRVESRAATIASQRVS